MSFTTQGRRSATATPQTPAPIGSLSKRLTRWASSPTCATTLRSRRFTIEEQQHSHRRTLKLTDRGKHFIQQRAELDVCGQLHAEIVQAAQIHELCRELFLRHLQQRRGVSQLPCGCC